MYGSPLTQEITLTPSRLNTVGVEDPEDTAILLPRAFHCTEVMTWPGSGSKLRYGLSEELMAAKLYNFTEWSMEPVAILVPLGSKAMEHVVLSWGRRTT